MGNTLQSATSASTALAPSTTTTLTDNSSSNTNSGTYMRVDPTDPLQMLGQTQTRPNLTIDVTQLDSANDRSRAVSSINCRSAFQALNLEEIPCWKNTCKIDINQVPYVWIYSSLRQNGWWFMSSDINDKVETLYQKFVKGEDLKDENHIIIGGQHYKYNFDKMAQINRQSGAVRTIRRIDINKIREIEDLCAQRFQQLDSIWLYQLSSSRGFVPFLPNFQEEVEASYQDYLSHPDDPMYVHYNYRCSNGYEYQLNFTKMTQINRQTGVRRELVRQSRQDLMSHGDYQSSSGFSQPTIYHFQSQSQPDVNTTTSCNNTCTVDRGDYKRRTEPDSESNEDSD